MKQLGNANYHAIQLFETVHIVAYGENSSSGYRNFFEQSPLKIYPPIHNFFSEPPSGIALPLTTPFVARTSFFAGEKIETVTIHDANGAHKIGISQISPVDLDLHKIIESSAQGVIHIHGTQDDVKKAFSARSSALQNSGAAYYEKSLGRWVDPFTPPRITAECVKWCSITPWDKWCCGHAYKTEVIRVEAFITVTIANPADIQEQIELALRDAAVVGAFAALAAALATGGAGAGSAFVSSFTAAFQAKLASLIAEQIINVSVVFRTEWGPL